MDASELVDALTLHIRTQSGGWANQGALRRAERLIGALMASAELSEAHRRRLQQLRGWAGLLYSTRKHRRWEHGASSIRNTMLLAVESMRPHPRLRRENT